MNILIVGVSGFLGKALYSFLKKKNINIYSISRSKFINKNHIKCDITNLSILSAKLNKLNINFDFIINLSGQANSNKLKMKKVIIDGNKNLINYFKNKKTNIILVSSILVYLSSNKTLTEKAKLSPRDDYSLLKIKAENLIKKNCKNYIIFRLGNIYDSDFKKKGLFKNIIKSKISFKKIKLLNIMSSRSYLHLNDFCSAIYKCIMNFSNKKKNKIYNLGNQNLTNMQIIKTFEKIFKVKINYQNLNKSFIIDPIIKINSNKFLKKYNFKFKYNFENELKKYEKKYF